MVSVSPMKLEAVPSSSTRNADSIAPVASSIVTIRSSSGPCGSQACLDPAWNTSIPGSGRHPLLAMRRALRRLRGQAAQLQHALRPRVAAQEALTVRHRAAVDRLVEVLGREVEVARAKL